jgi:hypothetical protein
MDLCRSMIMALMRRTRLSARLLGQLQQLRLTSDDANAALQLLTLIHQIWCDRSILARCIPTIVHILAKIFRGEFVNVTIFSPFKQFVGDDVDRGLELGELFVARDHEMSSFLLPGLAKLCAAYYQAAQIWNQTLIQELTDFTTKLGQELMELSDTLRTQSNQVAQLSDLTELLNAILEYLVDELLHAEAGHEFVSVGGGFVPDHALVWANRRVTKAMRNVRLANRQFRSMISNRNHTRVRIVDGTRLLKLKQDSLEQLLRTDRELVRQQGEIAGMIDTIWHHMRG